MSKGPRRLAFQGKDWANHLRVPLPILVAGTNMSTGKRRRNSAACVTDHSHGGEGIVDEPVSSVVHDYPQHAQHDLTLPVLAESKSDDSLVPSSRGQVRTCSNSIGGA